MIEVERYFLSSVGIDPSKYYINTLRNNNYIAKSWEYEREHQLEMFRYVAYATFASTIAMNGKQVFSKIKKPSDLFKIAGLDKKDDKALEGDAANDFMKNIVKQ